MLLQGKNAIVTGGSQGIGTATSLMLAEEGANVCLTYRSHKEEAEAVAKQIEAMGRKALAVKCDIASFSEAEAVVKAALEAFGGIDILVNNAGINWDGVIWKMTEEQWDTVITVNLKGYFNYNKAAAMVFKDQKGGKIVNVSSINGLRGKFGQTNYSASKGGEIAMSKTLARELGKDEAGIIDSQLLMLEDELIWDTTLSRIRTQLVNAEAAFARSIGETTDVAYRHPDVVARLTSLAEWAREDIGDYNRIGKNARFFDPDPKRPDIKERQRRKAR